MLDQDYIKAEMQLMFWTLQLEEMEPRGVNFGHNKMVELARFAGIRHRYLKDPQVRQIQTSVIR